MSSAGSQVIIIGGGLGGLCLAQGLKRAGVHVAVYERDRTPNDRLQGYRIHIEPGGNRALRACLPPELFNSYIASSGSGGAGYRISTQELKELICFHAPAAPDKFDPAKLDLSVSRISLRQVLLSGLDEVVHFNKVFSHYRERPDGTITACFEDGSSASGDVLIAADGGSSRVRKQFLPHAQRAETGVVAIMGKLALTKEVRNLLMSGRLDRATSILGPKGHALFVAMHDRSAGPSADAGGFGGTEAATHELHPGLLFDNLSDYVFWGFLARREKYGVGGNMQQMDGPALQKLVLGMIEGWHPCLRQLIGDSDPATIICKPLHTSTPIKPWTTKRITLIGDAIHSMPPTRGIGGNTALRDAQLLCQNLIAAQLGKKPLLQAIHDYEVEMIKYGFAAVRGSMRALDLHVADSRFMTNAMLRSMNAFFRLQRLGA